jgi:glucosamine-6-phosphate deaminase
MGIGAILHAKQILLLVKGKDKLDALQRAIYGPITTQCPASFLQVHPHVLILTDAEAGAF